jgi:hypothetical protein
MYVAHNASAAGKTRVKHVTAHVNTSRLTPPTRLCIERVIYVPHPLATQDERVLTVGRVAAWA